MSSRREARAASAREPVRIRPGNRVAIRAGSGTSASAEPQAPRSPPPLPLDAAVSAAQRHKRRADDLRPSHHPQRLRPAERDVRVEAELLALDQRQLAATGARARRPPARPRACRGSTPRQKWMPRPKARWRRALSRSRSKASGSGKTDASRPAAASHRKSLAPAGSSTPPTRRGLRRHAPPDADGGIEAQRLLDRARDRRGIGDDALPARRVLEQAPHEVADEVVRRLVAGEAQREEDRGDLLERERLGVLVVDVDQRAREVVGAALRALGHQLAQVAAVGDDVLGVLDLLLGRAAGRRSARRGSRTSA